MIPFLPNAVAALRTRITLPCVVACGLFLAGCSTSTHVFREFPSRVAAADTVAVLAWHYRDSTQETPVDRVDDDTEKSLFDCVKNGLQHPDLELRHISFTAFRHAELWDRADDRLPGGTDAMLNLLVSESVAGNPSLAQVRYVVLLQVHRLGGEASTLTEGFAFLGRSLEVRIDASVIDIAGRRVSGMLHTRSGGLRGVGFMAVPLPIPFYANPDSAGCEEMGEELLRFFTEDPQN